MANDSAMDLEVPLDRQCWLLLLPAELRNSIYSYILVQPTGLCDDRLPRHLFPGAPPPTCRSRRRLCANILRTCKQINQEASPILYGQNVFAAHPSLLTELPSLLLTTRPNRTTLPPVLLPRPLSMIRRFHIHVRLDTDPRFDRGRLQESFSGIEELEIQVFQAMYGGCDFSVLELFDEIRGIGKARVVGSIGDGRYATWLETSMMSRIGCKTVPYQHTADWKNTDWSAWAAGNR